MARSGKRRVYQIDNNTHQVTELDIALPDGAEPGETHSLTEYDEGYAAGYAAAQAALAAEGNG